MNLTEALDLLFVNTINTILEETDYTIIAKQNSPRPSGPYATVDLAFHEELGWPVISYQNEGTLDLTENIENNNNISYSINFFRENAVDNARKVKNALKRSSINELFRSINVGLISSSEVREISEPIENGWEERSQFDIVINTVGDDSDIIAAINSVTIGSEFQTSGNTYNFNIEV